MSNLPFPVRIAAGLMATALEQACKLPEQLAAFPITAASRAVQAGMRVQQRLTELAIKGDQVFSLLRPVEDTPAWATFDEDEPDGTPAPPNGAPPNVTGDGAGTGPDLLSEYDSLSLTQLRARLRGFSLAQLTELLAHEQAHHDRPAFLTLLSNRISSVRSR
ncbi:MAG TPA: lipid droplet-associated protein [Pseudonocardiaceae bacterium]|nr:lipid droplet-associated protein [Pseudonocardiaceae bacterium]